MDDKYYKNCQRTYVYLQYIRLKNLKLCPPNPRRNKNDYAPCDDNATCKHTCNHTKKTTD